MGDPFFCIFYVFSFFKGTNIGSTLLNGKEGKEVLFNLFSQVLIKMGFYRN